MQTELIQLLKNEDANNIKLGCILARAAGHSDVEIVDNMYHKQLFDVNESVNYVVLGYDNILFRICINDGKNDILLYDFRIWNKSGVLFNKTKSCRFKQYNKTKAEYSTFFIDMIINR